MTDTLPSIPGYRIQKQMGQGGMATVYLAVQESFGRPVALKVMSDQLGQDDIWAQRFMHEARVVAQLSHSNIVPVFDVGSHEGRFYISMELLKGGKLDDKIHRGLTTEEAIRIVSGVAAGLDYAGSKGFVHRDIKPDNIMFRDDGTPVILDFGIAKQKDGDSKMTKTGTIVGTTGYMSPEQAMGQELDERSDIYSLGIMLYELLTGTVPFRGDSAVAVLLKHVQEVPPPLPMQLSIFQPCLDRALAKKPEDRYQRASEMMLHLQELLSQFKQQTHPPLMDKTTVLKQVGANDATVITSAVAPSKETPSKKFTGLHASVAIAMIVAIIIGAVFLRGKSTQPSTTQSSTTVPHSTPVDTTVKTTTATEDLIVPLTPSAESQEAPPTPDPTEQQSTPVVTSMQTTSVTEDLSPALPDTPVDSNQQRAIARILLGARACLKNQQYDCAKSKAESALDLDPDNIAAQKILSSASKAQQEAFAGDWDAK